MTELRRSPLDAEHRRLGAKLVDFGGWEMPLAYPTGTLSEHQACRDDAVAFDVSHLGTVRVSDGGAFDRLQSAFTNDLRRIGPGRAQYTHLLADDGSVLDDIIVWWRGPEHFEVMPNAANTRRVVDAVGGEDVTDQRAVVAVQGPNARSRVATFAPDAAMVAHFGVQSFTWKGVDAVAAGTGYTGEDGIEVSLPLELAEDFWHALIDAGVTPAGLGARDTLRLEAGLPLHGHELGPGITPLQAGLSWVVSWDKGPFVGRDALVVEKERGVARRLRAMVTEGRQPPRDGNVVSTDDGAVGTITSGNYSPVLGRGIALGFLSPSIAVGARVQIDIRGRAVAAEVVKPPFVKRP